MRWAWVLLVLVIGCGGGGGGDTTDTACTAQCAGKQCGDDGCGGSCGVCPLGKTCQAGLCAAVCTPNCVDRTCGMSDGCGGLCTTCPAPAVCNPSIWICECPGPWCGGTCCQAWQTCGPNGVCQGDCPPACDGKECGDDGCGGTCGTCPAGHVCESDACCAVNDCGQCGPLPEEVCNGADDDCDGLTDEDLPGCTCEPKCAGKDCGDDGCGGSCGTCPSGSTCVDGACEEDPCDFDPCAPPTGGDDLPDMCQYHEGCGSQADCSAMDNWSVTYTCDEGKCLQAPRECESEAQCYDWCRDYYADFYKEGSTFTWCEDAVWKCAKTADCPGVPKTCQPHEGCGSQADCSALDSWSATYTCDGGQCLYAVRECESVSQCLDWCRDFYADIYEQDPAFTWCEDSVWSCAKAADCPDLPRFCQPHEGCGSQADCSTMDNWSAAYTCDDGKCLYGPQECESEAQCYDWCRDFYAENYEASPTFSWCEDTVWSCGHF